MLRRFLAIVGGAALYALALPRFDLWPCAWLALVPRRYLVRASTTGVSAIVDAWGRILATQPPDGVGVALAGVAPRYDLTPYVRFGDVFAIACALAVLFALGYELVLAPRRRRLVLPVPAEG
jgi:apolipoprotein N-acyltransferase